ncbi:MAG TPA: hypothetical protein V6C71_05565 [Coleofasciculaceae cyanobacterium]
MCGESRKHGFEWECQRAISGSTPNVAAAQIVRNRGLEISAVGAPVLQVALEWRLIADIFDV